MAKFKWKQKVNISRVITKIVATAVAMWIGGKVLAAVATSMDGEQIIFAQGLNFLGFGVENSSGGSGGTLDYMTGTVASTGVVSVIGLVGAATIILEFVQVSF